MHCQVRKLPLRTFQQQRSTTSVAGRISKLGQVNISVSELWRHVVIWVKRRKYNHICQDTIFGTVSGAELQRTVVMAVLFLCKTRQYAHSYDPLQHSLFCQKLSGARLWKAKGVHWSLSPDQLSYDIDLWRVWRLQRRDCTQTDGRFHKEARRDCTQTDGRFHEEARRDCTQTDGRFHEEARRDCTQADGRFHDKRLEAKHINFI